MRFSIIVVCLNPGEKLNQTLESILSQTCRDYEIIIKDGGSRDGSIEGLQKSIGSLESRNIRLYAEKDSGIYDAMNQAVSYAEGEYLIFMNCGDAFFDREVLEKIDGYIKQEAKEERAGDTPKISQTAPASQMSGTSRPLLLYGNTYSVKNRAIITSPPRITGFTCYRNIPCHQSCVYAARLCKEKPYDLQYKIRADYDHFLWCYYAAEAKMVKMDITAAAYEGGGFSESKENLKRDREEHKRITAVYMKKEEIFKYRLLLWCTLAPLRRWLAESPVFSDVYHRIKGKLYR